MTDLQIAILSDIHGNRWALEEILTDIRKRRIEQIVNLGDCLYGPLDPAGTAELLLALDLRTVRGNEDRILFEPSVHFENRKTVDFVLENLKSDHLAWLKAMPLTGTISGIGFMCHGTPDHDETYLLHEARPEGVFLRETGDIITRISSVKETIIFCCHDHSPRTVLLPDDRLIVNPGSVGLQAYTDDSPVPHAIETGTPHTRYSILRQSKKRWIVENIALSYDWQAAAKTAEKNGRPDWAEWLTTGRASL